MGEFLERLVPFLRKLPMEDKYAVEVRNKNWFGEELATVQRDHGVALSLVDLAWMPCPSELLERGDPVTADFSYLRWLGDRKGIEERTKTWDKAIVDQQSELREWVNVVCQISGTGVPVFAYANNHSAGHAPATVELIPKAVEPAGEVKRCHLRRRRTWRSCPPGLLAQGWN